MPKVKPLTENQQRDRDFQEQLHGMMKTQRITFEQLAENLGISVITMYRRRDNPGTLTLNEQRILKKIFPRLNIQ